MRRFFFKWLALEIVLFLLFSNICCIAAENGKLANNRWSKIQPHGVYFFRDYSPLTFYSTPYITIRNAEIIVDSSISATDDLILHGRRIVTSACSVASELPMVRMTVNANGYRIYPALINAHDHGFGNWSPPIQTPKFNNYIEWIDHSHKHMDPTVAESNLIALSDRLELTYYKQVFNGVGTVELFVENKKKYYVYQYPIRMLDTFTHSHSVLTGKRWTALDYARTKGVQPFLIHLGEGKGEAMRKELDWLDRLGALSSNTVLVHGIAFRESDWKKIACAGASLVWCPSSNMHLYGATADIPGAVKAGVRVCLGTDGAITGGKGLLQEMRTARRLYPELSSRMLFDMVTKTAASILGIDDKLGTLDPGKLADLLVIRKKSDDPFKDLMDSQAEDIGLLMVGGVPVYGDASFLNELHVYSEHVKRIQAAGKEKFLVGDIEKLLASFERRIGHAKDFDFLPSIERIRDNATE